MAFEGIKLDAATYTETKQFSNPQALSSALAVLGRYSLKPSGYYVNCLVFLVSCLSVWDYGLHRWVCISYSEKSIINLSLVGFYILKTERGSLGNPKKIHSIRPCVLSYSPNPKEDYSTFAFTWQSLFL